jgi:PAS domain S-box-containing protein
MYLDIAPVMFVAISMDERVTLINQQGCRIIGLPESSIVGKNWFDIFKPADIREEERERFRKLKEVQPDQEFTSELESVIVNSKGGRRIISSKAVLIRDHSGKPITLLASGDDVTERRQQEKRIEQVNIELKANSDEILKLNSELEDRVAKRTEELGDLVGKMELANAELATEVRERRQAEELLQKNREELRASLEKEKELGELKSRFVTMASHEFRTPLSTILSSASLVSKYNGGDQLEQRTKHLERIKYSVNNLTAILNDFLSIGKLEEGKVHCNPSEFDMVSFATELTSEMRELTKRGQTITHVDERAESKVVLDKNLTRNICINLLSNAIKYSEEGKNILFKTGVTDGKLEISVTDEGIGIPETEQQHIFDRFFRAKNAVNIQGTGLGLNIVKKYAELMGGQIFFTSQQGKGTTFHVTLPQSIE